MENKSDGLPWDSGRYVCYGFIISESVWRASCGSGNWSSHFSDMLWKCNVWILGGGIAVGLCFLGISRLTGEGIGYGDSIMILLLGIYLGIWKLLIVLSGAFFLLALAAVVLLSYYSIRGKGMAQGTVGMKKISRKYALPFYPFLTCGYILYLVSWK